MLNLRKISKYRSDLHGIPWYFLQGFGVLCVAALLGLGLKLVEPVSDNAPSAYAEEGEPVAHADTSASLTIDDGKIKDTVFAATDQFVYAKHDVSISANNVKNVSLTLNLTSGLSGPSTVGGAGGKTPTNMNNAWGYAWTDKGADPNNATYQTVNASNNLTGVSIDSSHNVNTTKQLIFGAKFGVASSNGTYHAEATLSLVATPRVVTNWKVTYNCNSGSGCPSNLDTSSDADSYSYTIPSTEPTRSGYKFLGYSTTNGSTADSNYAAGKTISLTTTNPTRTLYAIWQQTASWNTITTMQEMTPAICAGASVGASKSLTDTRGNTSYTVAKLADGNCWMTQNLRLAGGTAITSANSDVSANYTLPAATTGAFSNTQTNGTYENQQMRNSSDNDYGAYYSWCTATAGTCMTNSTTPVPANTDASSSICPKGWKLPKGGSSGDFQALKNKYPTSVPSSLQSNNSKNGYWLGAASTAAGGAFFPAAGYVYTGGLGYTGSGGGYWSRTASGTTYAYNLYFSAGSISPASSSGRYYGYSVRCVAYSS